MKRLFLCIFLLLFSISTSVGQHWETVTDQEVVVNSRSNMTGYTRNRIRVELPFGCKNALIRLSSYEPNKTIPPIVGLLSAVATLKGFPQAGQVAGLALGTGSFGQFDFFLLDELESYNFYNKADFRCYQQFQDITSITYSFQNCPRVFYIGLRNNAMRTGIKIKAEVVAWY